MFSCLFLVTSIKQNFESAKVVACSASKRAYRERIRQALPNIHFIFLEGNSELIRSRIASLHCLKQISFAMGVWTYSSTTQAFLCLTHFRAK